MDEFIENVQENDQRKYEIMDCKFFANGQTKEKCTIIQASRDDQFWKIKKRLLKKLKYKNYKSAQLQSEVRIFSVKGIEFTEDDMEDLFQKKSVFYSLGDDFDYSVRVNALKFEKHLGKGGFGEVNLCLDELTGE